MNDGTGKDMERKKLVHFLVLLQHLNGQTEENHDKDHSRKQVFIPRGS